MPVSTLDPSLTLADACSTAAARLVATPDAFPGILDALADAFAGPERERLETAEHALVDALPLDGPYLALASKLYSARLAHARRLAALAFSLGRRVERMAQIGVRTC